jgi:DNA-directed RNA polymerase specialized sigma24 family protein
LRNENLGSELGVTAAVYRVGSTVPGRKCAGRRGRGVLSAARLDRDRARFGDVAATESLRLALATLPFKQRAAIVLRFFEDVPDEVTAQVLGCRQATVRSHIHRGLETLRAELGEWVP